MPNRPLNAVVPYLLADLTPDGGWLTDSELLTRFLGGGDENALAALVRRHAPLVWGVCSRMLHHHDAEDAFQATFLVLVRKADGVPREAVANWLYGVARQTAVRVRSIAAKQRRREAQLANPPEPAAPEPPAADTQAVDEEVSRLPGHYRAVVVLCDLEGLTREQAARQLDVPAGSVASRLARARALLAKRLARRGVGLSAGALAVGAVPPEVTAAALKTTAGGVVSARVSTLTNGVLRAMTIQKVKTVGAVLLALAAVAGVGGLFAQTPAIVSAVEKKLELQRLQGTWKPVALVSEDEKADDKNLLARLRLVIKDDTFQVLTRFDLETPVKESLDAVVMEGRIEIDPEKSPGTMDWHVKSPKRPAPILKAYEVSGDKLRIVTGSGTERPTLGRRWAEGTRVVHYERVKGAK